jgi:DNA-binding NtrC family response regulator
MSVKTAVIITPDVTAGGYRVLGEALHKIGFSLIEVHPVSLPGTLNAQQVDLAIVGLGPFSGTTDLASRLTAYQTRFPVLWLLPPFDVAAQADKPYAITYPSTSLNVVSQIETCLKAWSTSKQAHPELNDEELLIGNCPQISLIKARIRKIAPTDCNVLITGETGTGKECVATLIHKNGRRRDKPFISVNCAAIPDSLLESELFGYEKGAFTGAGSRFVGKLKLADQGTIFLDEIGDMSSLAQAKILRSLETREIQHLGGVRSYPVDIRVIAATNKNLEVNAGSEAFRRDLFYRLNVAQIQLPPLRERKGDICLLLEHYLRKCSKHFGIRVTGCAADVLQAFLQYDWPGNVREFKNLIEATFIEGPGETIELKDLPLDFRARLTAFHNPMLTEYDRLILALMACGWNKSLVAKKLGCSRMTVYRSMMRYNIAAEKNV